MSNAGALIENAARYAPRRVRITGEAIGAGCLIIEDDGPGIDSEKVAEALMRGGRLFETLAVWDQDLRQARSYGGFC